MTDQDLSEEYQRGWRAAESGGSLVLSINGGHSDQYAQGYIDRMKSFVELGS